MQKIRLAVCLVVLVGASAPAPINKSAIAANLGPIAALPTSADQLTIMTYNVKGLPWPVAQGRTAALEAIGLRLQRLRKNGAQPHVVVLQEAFTPAAKEIARIAGYRFVGIGPQPNDSKAGRTTELGTEFVANASWTKGETEGKWVDSGLVTLSDYPIEKSAKMVFPREACAGFDCLAAKGVLITWIKPGDQSEPIAIINTHLNSRGASGVPTQRANSAYARQFDSLVKFVGDNVGIGTAVIFSGDLNVGTDPLRRKKLAQTRDRLKFSSEALRHLASTNSFESSSTGDLAAIIKRSKDMQFFRPGLGSWLHPRLASVPFGTETDGSMLSDHMGFVISYSR